MLSRMLCCSFTEKSIPSVIISHRYKAQDTPARKTFEQALTGAFMSAVIKDLRPSALPFVASLIRHYTMVAVAQQCGEDTAPEESFVLLLTAAGFKKSRCCSCFWVAMVDFCLTVELCLILEKVVEIMKEILKNNQSPKNAL